MKTRIIVFAALFISFCAFGQNDDALVKTMLEQANVMGKKFLEKDYTGFLKYGHPRTIEVMGGLQTAVTKMTTQMKQIEEEGIYVIGLTYGTPSKIIRVDGELQSTLPQILEMRVSGGVISAPTTMLAISKDMGKNWYFLDTANYNHADMKLLLPNLSDEIIIPERTDPSFEPDSKENIKSE